jgi:pyruvate dehydrogenase E2 component (dihydrolipoamide acetyltransferase)
MALMADFVMPSLGADMDDGTLAAWLKQPGDAVKRGDIVAVVHTDKADVEVEVFTSGVIERMLIEPGTEVPVGTPLAVIREEAPPRRCPCACPRRARRAHRPHRLRAPPGAGAREHRLLISPSAGSSRTARHRDRRAAGSGPAAASSAGTSRRPPRAKRRREKQRRRPPAPPPAVSTPSAAPALPAAERSAAMRRAIAASMSRSKREIPHFYLGQTIDMSRTIAWLGQENLRRPVTERLLHGALLIKAVALALREVPELNATWEGDEAVRRDDVNVGVAIALRGGGLVAPALHHTDELTLEELMHAFRDLVSRARAGSLRSSEMSEPTITVTSLGERGVEALYGVNLPAAGRDRRVRHARRAAVDHGGADPPLSGRDREPVRRPPRHRRPPRQRVSRSRRPSTPGAGGAMTPEEIRQAVLQALTDIAPEADHAAIRTDLSLRDQLDIDSMDSLNFHRSASCRSTSRGRLGASATDSRCLPRRAGAAGQVRRRSWSSVPRSW